MRRLTAIIPAIALLFCEATSAIAQVTPSRVVTWGFNGNGQLGFADESNFLPSQVHGLEPGSGVIQIAAGAFHSLALKSDGSVLVWGLNNVGQLGDGSTVINRLAPAQVVGLGSGSGVVAVAAGSSFSMALKSDGTVLTWGLNLNGQLGDGTTTSRSTPGAVSGLGVGSGVIAIATGPNSAYALKSDGTVLAWGNNANGRLGDGSTTQQNTPVQVSGLGSGSGIVALAASSEASHVLALNSNGSVVAWGNNATAQLGDGTTTQRTSPVPVSGLGVGSSVVGLATGGSHSLALKSDGSVVSWGFNSSGQLGDGTFFPARFTPVPVSGLNAGSGIIALTAGSAFSMALKADGTALSWGLNANGQLGSNSANPCCSSTPLLVTGLAGGGKLAAGNNHALTMTSSGGVLSWGGNASGQLGRNSVDANPFPTGTFNDDDTGDGRPLPDVIAVSGGGTFSLALKSDGTVRSWGINTAGQLGNGFADSTMDGPAMKVKNSTGTGFLTGITAISAGSAHSIALQSDGTAWTWGGNANGQLGDGTNTQRLLPVQVSGFGPGSGVVAVSAGFTHNLALKLDGSVWAWGGNGSGQLGDGTTTQRTTPVPVNGLGIGSGVVAIVAANTFSLAMKADGTVWAWGSNGSGQLGDGTVDPKLAPVQVKDPTGTTFLTNITAIAANGSSFALRSDGTVWSWGANGAGQLGDGSFASRSLPGQVVGLIGAVAIASGSQTGMAMKADGSVWTWGFNQNGNLGIGTINNGSPVPVHALLSNAAAIAAGSFHNLVLVPMSVSPVTLAFDTSTPGAQVQLDGINFTAEAGSIVLMPGTSFSVNTPSPQKGPAGTRYVFANWSDGGAISHVISVPNVDFALELNFTTQYLLTTSIGLAGSGTIIATPSSPDGYYESGVSVQLNATPAPGYFFAGWSGDLTGTTNPQSVVMSSPRNVIANFAALVNITIDSAPSGRAIVVDNVGFTAPQTFQWQPGTNHTIATSSPQFGLTGTRYLFSAWSDGGAISHAITVPATAATYTANFATHYELTTAVFPAGAGTVSPATGGYYAAGQVVPVSATGSGNAFINWTGPVASPTNPSSTVIMNGPVSVIANFTTPTTLTLNSSSNPSVFGQQVTLTATVTPASATGKVTFYDGVAVLGAATVSNGAAVLQTSLLEAGNHNLKAFYTGDSSHTPGNSSTLQQNVSTVPQNGFQPAVNYVAGVNSYAVAVADFNNDGRSDVAVTNSANSTVGVLLGTGDGVFAAAINSSLGAANTLFIVAADLNEDGITDLITGGSTTISVLLGAGNGSFQAPVLYTTGSGSQTSSIVAADFNKDGHVDLAVVNYGGSTISVLQGRGDGTLQAAVNYSVPVTPISLAAADFNSDGNTDLAVGSPAGNLTLLLGSGTGTFQSGSSYNTGFEAEHIGIADFNGDGRPDVAVASFPESGVKILLGNGNGTLQAPVLYGAGLRPFFLEIGDFNGDGKSDVAVTHSEPTTVNILFGNGDGTLNTGIAYNVGDLARIAAAGEFNGDGVTDLAVATIGGLRILLGVPATRTITINTAPAGLGFSVDNVSYSGTQTFEWVIGSTHTIAVTSPQAGAIGTRYVFANWSDGGATSHTVTGPATATTYTANFTTQYLLTTSTIPDGVGGVNADPPSADGYYDSGANVQLGAAKTAFKSAQYLFTGWSGDLTGTVSPQSIVMSSPRNVTVNYALAVTVVINTEPAGLSFVVDSDTLTTPIKATWIVGSNHTIAVTSPQAGSNGTQYVFANWSDGGAMSHTVTVPATGTTYTANFTEHIGSVEGISTVTMTIPSKAGPWSPTLNPTLDYGVHDNAAPVVVDASSGIVLTPGSTLTVTYRSGTVQAGAGYPIVDANGEPGNVTNSCIGNCFPAVHMNPGPDVFSMKLVGAFANNGIVVGKPFPIGNGPTALTVPAGANQLLLGINDNFYSDNSGSLSVAIAVTTTVLTVPSTAGPWSPTLNPSFNYGVHDNTAPVIVDASIGILLTPGSTLTVTYRGGTVQAGAGYPIVDANGEPGNVTNTCSGNCFPAVHMNPGPDVFSMKLVGTFANNGIIVGKPFPIGNGPTALTVPAGANQLLLGINDNFYSDNSGSLTVAVAVTGVTPIIPSKAGPWSPTLNPALDYGVHDNTPPVVIDLASGIPFIPGSTVTVTYRSGTVQAGAGYPIVDANGEPGNVTNSCTGNCFPAVHMNPGPDVFSMKLVGAFASNGIVVGKPFPIGNGPTALTVPAGANQLLLGINDNFYGDNSGFFMVTVALTMTPTTTTVTPSVNPSSFAQAVTFAASVSPSAATGTVQFQIDGADLGSPVALSNGQAISGSISTLVAGNHTITAAYSGDSNFLASSGTATNDVLRAPTTATLAVNLATAVYGQMVGLTATVTSPAGVPVGTVTFYDFPQGAPSTTLLGSSPVNSSGQASLTVLLSAGAHTVYAVMGSSANFSQSNQAQAAVSISIASTSTSLISSPNPSNSGQTVNFAATVTGQYGGPVTGTVTFKRGTNTVLGTAALVNGSATLPLSTLGVGPHSVTAVYGGDANDAGSASAAITQNVVVPFTTNSTISSSANPSLVTRAVTFTAVVTSTSPGTPTGTVTFMSGGITVLGTSPLSGGQAILSTSSLPAGSSGITAVYNGDPQFAGSTSPSLNQVVNKGTSTTVLTSTLNPSNVGQTVRFNVLLSCSTGFVPTGTVSLKQGNTVIATVSSPPGPPLFGTISLGVDVSSLKSGNNNLKAVYGGDAYCAGSTSNTVQQVVR